LIPPLQTAEPCVFICFSVSSMYRWSSDNSHSVDTCACRADCNVSSRASYWMHRATTWGNLLHNGVADVGLRLTSRDGNLRRPHCCIDSRELTAQSEPKSAAPTSMPFHAHSLFRACWIASTERLRYGDTMVQLNCPRGDVNPDHQRRYASNGGADVSTESDLRVLQVVA
jgi:hypothetical protein